MTSWQLLFGQIREVVSKVSLVGQRRWLDTKYYSSKSNSNNNNNNNNKSNIV